MDFQEFFVIFNVFITIREYADSTICISYYRRQWLCLSFIMYQVQWSRISNSRDMASFVCTPLCSRIVLTVAMETIFFIVQLSLFLRTTILCISGVPMNDLAPMKNCLVGLQGRSN